MKNEEAIAWLEHHFDPLPDGTKQSEAVCLAIKALEQEPCDDVISRQAVLDIINLNWDYRRNCIRAIEKLPSVNTQESKWIPVSERFPEKYTYTLWCASSGCVRSDYFNGEFWEDAKKYCYRVIAWMPLPKPYEPQ